MLSPRWKKVWQDLLRNKARSTLVVLSISVGIFAIGVIGTTQLTLGENMTRSWVANHPAHAKLQVTDTTQAEVDRVRTLPGVADAQGRRRFIARVKVGPESWKDLLVQAFPDFDQIRMDYIHPVAGAWPPPPQEILLERATLAWLHVKVGDTIQLETPAGGLHTVRVAGSAYELSSDPVFLTDRGAAYVSMDTLAWLGEPAALNAIQLTVADGAADADHIREVAVQVAEDLHRQGVLMRDLTVPAPGKHPISDLLSAFMLILGALGVVALLLSGFLVVNVVSALLAQQVRQIGVMKAVGARPLQVTGLYLGMVALMGGLALLLGVPLGALGAWGLGRYLGNMMNLDTGFSLPWPVLAVQIAIGLLLPVAAAALPAIAATRRTTRESLQGSGSAGQAGNGFISRLISKAAPSRPLQLSLRNTFRRKGRLALTLSTLILGAAVAIGVFSTRASAMRTLDNALQYYNFDFRAVGAEPFDARKAEAAAREVPGIVRAESWAGYVAYRTVEGKPTRRDISLMAPPAATPLIRPTLVEGRWLQSGDGKNVVVNSDLLKQEPDVRVGSDLELSIMGQNIPVHVVGVVTGQLSGPVVFADPDYIAQALQQTGLATFLVVAADGHDDATVKHVMAQLQERLKQQGVPIRTLQTTASMRRGAASQFQILVVFFLVMAGLLALVGALGLAGTMSINVLERTREIGVMRAIGAGNGTVLGVFLVEGLLIGLLSWIGGVALSVPFGAVLSNFVGIQFTGAPLDYVFAWSGAWIWLAVSIALAAASAFLPSRSAARLSVREVLAYE